MASANASPKGKRKGNVLTRKVGPLPAGVWALILVGGYLLYRSRKGAAGTSVTPAVLSGTGTAGASGDTSGLTTGGSGGGSQGAASGSPFDPNSSAYDPYAAMLYNLLGGGNVPSGTAGGLGSNPIPQDMTPKNTGGYNSGGGGGSYNGGGGGGGNTSAASQDLVQLATHPTPASSPDYASAAAAKTAAGGAVGIAQPFGGVTSTRVLANGATLTTYASGRQVEQAPGKTAYVVKA